MNPERLIAIVIAAGLHAYLLLFWKPSNDMIQAAGDESGTEVQVELAESASEPSDTPVEPTPPEPTPPEPPEPTPPEPEPEPQPVMEDAVIEPEPPKEKPKPKPQPKPVPKPAAPKAPPGVKNVAPSAGAAAGAAGGAANGSKDSSNPRWKRKVEPPYPTSAKAARIEGRVVVLISVSAEGKPTGARVIQSSGHAVLDDAAQRAAMSSTFYPTVRFGIPLADSVPAPYRFTFKR